ncbi:DNA repair protein RadC [Fulvivirga imtechensis AK7]|uniref:DNA repair protein RadC n=1 Tax=Fulvivirga imtechensis AK7 TaxID=1237149 RepID=L8JMX8_9BACT|nr:JAB domain-containing protein [Fulvivirga imtechensis]ELR70190.1 DNA repair protein RadC [Fulvivirga imtechensis AK7]
MENSKNKKWEVAEIQLVYKSKVKPSERPSVSSSQTAYEVFIEDWDSDKIGFVEEFKVMLLNRGHRVLGIYNLSCGGTTRTIVDPKLLFAAAIKSNASNIIVAHNHPSGSRRPSQPDINITKVLKEIGKLLEIPLLDHLIVTTEGFFSFSDEGLL